MPEHDSDTPVTDWSAEEPAPTTTFEEKMAWVMMISTLAVYIPYFVYALTNDIPAEMPLFTSGFIATSIAMVVIMVAGAIATAIYQYRLEGSAFSDPDERTKWIETQAMAKTPFISEAGLVCVIFMVIFDISPFWVGHAALSILVVSSLVYCSTVILLHRAQR